MKRPIPSLVLWCMILTHGWGQGSVSFDNVGHQGTSPTATSDGLFWDGSGSNPVLLTAPAIHGLLLGGPSENQLVVLVGAFGGDSSSVLLDLIYPGMYADDSGNAYIIPGVASGGTAWFEIFTWEGDASTLAEAQTMGDPWGSGTVFSQAVGGGLSVPASLTGMPAVSIEQASVALVPEPGTVSLAVLGAMAFVLSRRRS